MSKQFMLLVIVIGLSPLVHHGGDEKHLRFEARPTKSEFLAEEPIQFTFELHNVGPSTIVAPRTLLLYYDVQLEIVGPTGKPAAWCGRIPSILWPLRRLTEVKPHKSIRATATISCVGDDPGSRWGFELPEKGQYEVQAEYRPSSPDCSDPKKLMGQKTVECGPVRSALTRFVIR